MRFPRCIALAVVPAVAAAQRLPFARYDVADGLPAARVNTVLQDQHGFLWCGTWEGLARFDGDRFECFGPAEGLASPLVTTLALDPRGGLWVGTYGGLARLVEDRAVERPFELVDLGPGLRDDEVVAIAFEDADALWCGTNVALQHVKRAADGTFVPRKVLDEGVPWSKCFTRDAAGRLWCATTRAIVRLERGAVAERIEQLPAGGGVIAFVPRPGGATFVVMAETLYLAPSDRLDSVATWGRVELPLRPDELIRSALLDADGTLWLGTRQGVVTWKDGRARRFGPEQGLIDDIVLALCQDRDRNVWIGTSAQGLVRLPTRAIENWTVESGLPALNTSWLFEARDGTMVASTTRGLALLHDGRVELPPAGREPVVPGMSLHQDRRGDWWMIDDGRVLFARGPELDPRRAVALGAERGLPRGNAYGVFLEDARGDVWVSVLPNLLARGSAVPGDLPSFEVLPVPVDANVEGAPRASFALGNGDVWLAPFRGLWRRRGTRIDVLDVHGDGKPVELRWMRRARDGTAWIGTRFRGVWFTRDPESERPRFEPLRALEPLASQAVFAIAEDPDGRLWFGTGRGLDRLEPDGHVRHFGTAEGLAGEIVHYLHVDRAGFLWAATTGGVSRIDTRALHEPATNPGVRFIALSIDGVEHAIGMRGTRELDLGALASAQDNLLVEFTAPCLRRERELAFEYRLGDDAPWTDLGARRTLSFAGLAAGDYTASVRARVAAGVPAEGAALRFSIQPPFWRTPWFTLGVLAVAAAVAWTLHTARVRRLVAMEAMRRQIASDVHDEMGAGLAQIAVLAEVARRDATANAEPRLAEVARLARGLREAMSNIVWAVDPRQDSCAALVARLKHSAHNLFASGDVRVEFATPPTERLERLELAPDRRRQLFLVLEEALSNAARHAGAEHVKVELALDGRALSASVTDDGRGFEANRAHAGHGLAGMRRRVESLGGAFEARSAAGKGACIAFTVPLDRA